MRDGVIFKVVPIILYIFLTSCGVKDKEFNKTTWNDRDDFFYKNREIMVNDLIKNHLKKGMTYSELVDLIGKPENYGNLKPRTIGYELSVDYGIDIDPIKSKILIIELAGDSTILDYKVEKWKHE
jgi:hypothetical protein